MHAMLNVVSKYEDLCLPKEFSNKMMPKYNEAEQVWYHTFSGVTDMSANEFGTMIRSIADLVDPSRIGLQIAVWQNHHRTAAVRYVIVGDSKIIERTHAYRGGKSVTKNKKTIRINEIEL